MKSIKLEDSSILNILSFSLELFNGLMLQVCSLWKSRQLRERFFHVLLPGREAVFLQWRCEWRDFHTPESMAESERILFFS